MPKATEEIKKEVDDDTPLTPEEISQYEAQQEFIKKQQLVMYEKQ